jgi:hypothetical protein
LFDGPGAGRANAGTSGARRIIHPLKTPETLPAESFGRRHRAAAGVLLAANLLFFWPVLFHRRVFSSHDVVLATHPWRGQSGVTVPRDRLLADPATSSETQLRKFRDFPRGFFWNRAMACGAPGPVNFVQGNLSPFFWLPAIALPEAAIETGIVFLKLNFGFIFGYLFLRRRFSGTAASAGAAAWGWTSAQSCWWLWMHTSVSIFYPLVLLAVDHAFASRRFSRSAAVSGGVFLGMLSGGYPFWIVFGAAAGALYFLFRAFELGARKAARAILPLAAGAALALAILAPAALLSYRFLRETGHIAFRAGLGMRNPMPLRQLRLYFLPEYNGNPWSDDYSGVGLGTIDNYFETAVGVGPLAFGLAALGLASRRRRRLVAFAAVLAASIAAPLYAGGALLRFAGRVPGFSEGHFERAKILIVLAIAISCAAGVELAEDLFARSPRLRRVIAAVPYAIAVALLFVAAKIYPALPRERAVFRDTPGISVLRERGRGARRFLATGWTLMPDLAETLGLEDLRGHLLHEASYRTLLAAADPNVYGSTGTLLIFHGESLDAGSPVLDLLGAASIVSPPGVARPDSRAAMEADAGYPLLPGPPPRRAAGAPLPRVYSGPDMTIFARPAPFPRFFAVGGVVAGDASAAAGATRETLRSTAFASARDAARWDRVARAGRPGETSAEMVRDEDEAFEVAVTAPAPAVLASSQKRFEPYWKTYVDGKAAETFACDGPFLGVAVPAGTHRIEGRFRFPRVELAVSALAALLLLGLAAAAIRGRERDL